MTAVLNPDARAEWLAARKRGIGGSDAAAVVGLHPWVSPLHLYFEKRGEIPDQEKTEAMDWGLRLEPVVAQKWSEVHDRPIRWYPPYEPGRIRVHPDLPWMIANIDADVLDGRDVAVEVLECKTESGWAEHDYDDGPPPYVLCQVQHQLAVTGFTVAHVAFLGGGRNYQDWTVERDDAFIDALITAERHFLDRVERGDPPAADSHPSTGQALKARWQETLDEAIELGEEGYRLVTQRHRARAAAKAATEEQEEAENRLRLALGENEVGLVYGEVAATWRPDRNGNRRLIVKELS